MVITPGAIQPQTLPVSLLAESDETFLSDVSNLEVNSLLLLEAAENRKQVAGLRIAVGAEHAHQALGRLGGHVAKLLKADSSVDIIAQHRLAGFHVTGEQAFNPFPKECFTEGRIGLDVPEWFPW